MAQSVADSSWLIAKTRNYELWAMSYELIITKHGQLTDSY